MTQRYAIIEAGQVVNVTLAEPDFAAEQGWIAAPDNVGPGWVWDGQDYTPPPAPMPTVPATITMRQARLALLSAGLLPQVNAAIASLPSPQREAAEIDWEYATEVRRASPLIAGLAPALGLTGEQIDQLFIAAAAL